VLGALVFVALALLATFQFLSARRHLLAEAANLRDAASLVRPASRLRDPAARHTLRATLVQAEGEFLGARSAEGFLLHHGKLF
jgi:hypothetical protein